MLKSSFFSNKSNSCGSSFLMSFEIGTAFFLKFSIVLSISLCHSMSSYSVVVVDAFTEKPFGGNPAAVCVLSSEMPDDSVLKSIAAEMNLSETAFVEPIDAANGEFRLRWFTPTVEVSLCGHATLATAHVLFNERKLSLQLLKFRTMSGLLTVEKTSSGKLRMEFPAGDPIDVNDEFSNDLRTIVCDALKLQGGLKSILNIAHCAKTRKLLIETENVSNIERLAPSRSDLLAIKWPQQLDVRGVIVATRNDPNNQFDMISRYFAPWNGIDEDPVTGSAHCVLATYYAARLHKSTMTAFQASSRGGKLWLTVSSSASQNGASATTPASGRVWLDGHAVSVLRGEMTF